MSGSNIRWVGAEWIDERTLTAVPVDLWFRPCGHSGYHPSVALVASVAVVAVPANMRGLGPSAAAREVDESHARHPAGGVRLRPGLAPLPL